MFTPMELIDVVIRNTANEDYELVAAHTFEHLGGPFPTFAVAVVAARSYTIGNLFHQFMDNRGRVMTDPVLIQPESV
jgi:hypothetical protein